MSSLTGQGGYGSMASPSGQVGNKIPSGYKSGQISQFTPEQMQLFQQMFGQVGPESYTSRLAGGDQSLFDEMEAPVLKQFSALQGNLASRFSGMGSFGGRRSSGFQNSSNAEASDFAMKLQSQRQNLQRQAIQDLMGMSSQLLGQRPYEQFLVPKKQNNIAEIFGKLGGGLLSAFGGGGAGSALQGTMNMFGGGGDNLTSGYDRQFRQEGLSGY
jgi:hypothetical protein